MSKTSVQRLTYIALCAALIAVLAQVAIPMPLGVPMTMQTFAVPLVGILLGRRDGTAATALYLLLGAVGLPVFAGFMGGLGRLVGMTGGFLFSFPVMAWLAGWGYAQRNTFSLYASLVGGAVINYLVGMAWFVLVSGNGWGTAFTACVLPFIPTTIIKILLVGLLAPRCHSLLVRAHVLAG